MRHLPGIKKQVQVLYVFKIPAYFVLGWQECETNEKSRVWTKPDAGDGRGGKAGVGQDMGKHGTAPALFLLHSLESQNCDKTTQNSKTMGGGTLPFTFYLPWPTEFSICVVLLS